MKPEINFTKVFFRFSSAMVFFLILILGGTHAFADTANETESSTQEMLQNAQEIEKLCETPEGEARIRKNFMERFQIRDQEITELRGQGFGYGEISILYSLSEASGTDTAELLRLRIEEKLGWGKIANRTGSSLGEVNRNMKGLGRTHDDTVTTEKPVKSMDRIRTKERERINRPERPDRPEKPMKPGRPGKF